MLLQVDGLRKTFGRRTAVDGVGFSLDVDEIVGFLGPNGAGKTTTMRMIAGYLEPDEGLVKVFNIDVARAGNTRLLISAPRSNSDTGWVTVVDLASGQTVPGGDSGGSAGSGDECP